MEENRLILILRTLLKKELHIRINLLIIEISYV